MQDYDMDLQRAAEEIKKINAKIVCIQLPDGLKPKAGYIQQFIEENTGADVVVWLGSCWGGCDIPAVEKLGVELLIQWGHSEYIRSWQ